jgi:hypothetical protein
VEPFGIKGHNAKLDDESLAAGDHFFGQLKDSHRVLMSYQDDDLNEADLMSKRIAQSMLGMIAEGEKFRISTRNGVQGDTMVLNHWDPLNARNYIGCGQG